MSYIQDNLLNPKEEVMFSVNRSWFHYLPSLLIFYLILLGATVITLLQPVVELTPTIQILLTVLYIILAVSVSIIYATVHSSEEYVVTENRVITKEGIINHTIYEIHKENIESLDLKQGILARILNYGTIEINGTGDEDRRVKNINKPVEFRKAVQS